MGFSTTSVSYRHPWRWPGSERLCRDCLPISTARLVIVALLLTHGKKSWGKKKMEIILSLLLLILIAVYVMLSVSHCFPAEKQGDLVCDVNPKKCRLPPVLTVAVCIYTEVPSARQFYA